MSNSTVTQVVSLFSYKPKKDESTKQKQADALKQLEGAKGYKGFKFEGIAREAPEISVRCLEWESVEVSPWKVTLI
jgi:hypothetical protein